MTNNIYNPSPRAYARIAGVLILVSILAGGFGEFYVPSKLIVQNDIAATTDNFRSLGSFFRLGFASYLVEAICDVALALVLYVLLRPAGKNLALLAAFFGLVSATLFGVAELFYFMVAHIVSGAEYLQAFSLPQIDALATLSLKFSAFAGGIFMAFYGIASILRGYLVFRSGYLPRLLGILLMLGGVGFVVRNFILVLAPAYASDFLLLPTVIAMLSFALWLLIKGVDIAR